MWRRHFYMWFFPILKWFVCPQLSYYTANLLWMIKLTFDHHSMKGYMDASFKLLLFNIPLFNRASLFEAFSNCDLLVYIVSLQRFWPGIFFTKYYLFQLLGCWVVNLWAIYIVCFQFFSRFFLPCLKWFPHFALPFN